VYSRRFAAEPIEPAHGGGKKKTIHRDTFLDVAKESTVYSCRFVVEPIEPV